MLSGLSLYFISIFIRYSFNAKIRGRQSSTRLQERKKKKKRNKESLIEFLRNDFCWNEFLLGWKRREEKRGENFCWPARSWLERSVKAATPFSTYRVLSSLTKCPVCRAAMVLDLLPLHRQIRTCHGFIRSLVNDGGNTGGGSRQRRTVGDKSRFPTSAATQILRVCMCIHTYCWLLVPIS